MAQLAARYGTPLYIYSATAIRERLAAFSQAFREIRHTVCYSVKANSNLSILRLLARHGCGFDVVSGGELERVTLADRKSVKRVVFSGVGKTAGELDAALKAGILVFNVESEAEAELLAARAAALRRKARVAFRVNPDVPADTHPYISTGLREHKFGVPLADARRLYQLAAGSKRLEVVGVSVHIGSQITTPVPFAAAMGRVAELVRQLRSDGHRIRYVDAGGGLGIDYHEPSTPYSPQPSFYQAVNAYAEALMRSLATLDIHLLLEPGRAIVGPAGALVTRVLVQKQNGRKRFTIVDAAMNDLLRPSLYGAYHEIVPVESHGAEADTVDVVGPVCESGDFFARDRLLPRSPAGALLAVLDTGAYGMSLASNYNTRPRAAEVLVDGRRAKVIRKRETVKDLLRHER